MKLIIRLAPNRDELTIDRIDSQTWFHAAMGVIPLQEARHTPRFREARSLTRELSGQPAFTYPLGALDARLSTQEGSSYQLIDNAKIGACAW